MTKTLLRESTSAPLTKTGKRWRGVLAVPGKGSSGTYSEDVLRKFGPLALAPGSKAFIDHDDARSPRDMIGVYPDGAHYEEGVGLVGELEVFPHWVDFVEAVGPHAGLSIYMMGEQDNEGNIISLVPDRMNGVDLVSYAGLEGSSLVEKLYESAKISALEAELESTVTESSARAEEKVKEENMEQELIALTAIVSDLAAKFDAVESARAKEAAEAEAQAQSEKDQFDAFAAVEQVVEAKLTPALHSRVVEAVKAGNHDVAALIADAKAIQESVVTELTESASGAGVRIGSPAAGKKDVSTLGIFGGAK